MEYEILRNLQIRLWIVGIIAIIVTVLLGYVAVHEEQLNKYDSPQPVTKEYIITDKFLEVENGNTSYRYAMKELDTTRMISIAVSRDQYISREVGQHMMYKEVDKLNTYSMVVWVLVIGMIFSIINWGKLLLDLDEKKTRVKRRDAKINHLFE